ncbi:MAG: hypothetical protein ACOY3I_06870 [Verrucomicrobiota bacterium]
MRWFLLPLLAVGIVASAYAQNFEAPLTPQQKKALKKKEKVDISKPVDTGMVEIISKDGADAFNPWAPADVGSGKKNVTQRYVADESIQNPEEKRKEFSGIIFWGYLF